MAATIHSKYIRGNLAYYQTHGKRIIDAVGSDVVKYIDDFTSGPGLDAAWDNEWTVTRVEAGIGESTIARVDGSGGLARITTDANENDGINAQLIGEAFELTAGQSALYFGAFGVSLSDATQSDLFLGLAITDTDILGGATDSVGFRKVDASTTLSFLAEKDSTETTGTAATLVAATPVDLEFYFDGSSVEYFVNGVSVGSAITNIPNDEQLRVSWHFLTGAAAAITCDVDKIVCVQFGR